METSPGLGRGVRAAVHPRTTWSRRRRASSVELAAVSVDSPLLAQLLLNRGLTTPDAVAGYLDPPTPAAPGLADLAGLEQAVQRVERAVDDGQAIVVYGDYDVDGLSGSTVLQRALLALGARVEVFVPHRDRDGYGLNADVLRSLAARGAGLVVTVDCGVTAAAEVAAARAVGLDVVVTDHHEVSAELPAAVAVVNPHRPDCPYPFKKLAGAGVALKVAQTLLRRRLSALRAALVETGLFELAALGTISDVMPLVGENRAIVRHGLDALNRRPCPGVAALLARAGLERPWVEAGDVAFKLAPRLNAAGRLAEASTAQRLLACDGEADARLLADELEALNDQRRELASEALAHARAQALDPSRPLPPALVVHSPYPAGVLGLVAVRLAEETRRPVVVVEQAAGLSRGSVRAPSGFDAVGAVAACAEHLARFGGHQGAAGFSLESDRFEAFRTAFLEAAATLAVDISPADALVAECGLRPETVTSGLLDVLDRLGPFGHGCPEPLFETAALTVRESRIVGERHLRLKLSGRGRLLVGILFGAAEVADADAVPTPGSTIDILYRARPNVWRGERRLDLQIVAWRPSVD